MSLNERLEFLLNVNAEGAIKGFKAVGDEAEHNLTRAQGGIQKTGATMSKVGAGMVVGAGLIGVGLLELSKKWEESALSAGKLSAATGLTVEQASRWSVVAKGADTDTATLATSLGKMDKAIEGTPQKFAALGAEIVRTKDGAIDTNATFLNVVDALNAAGGAANNANTASAILGKGWQGMSEILKQSSGDLKTQLDSVSKAQIFSEADVSQAERFRDTMKELGNNVQGLAISLGKSAAPVIADVTTGLSAMVKGLGAANDATGGMIGKIGAMGALGVGAAGSLTLIAGQAIKMRDKLMPVGEDGARAMSGLGYAAVGVGLAVAGFGVITEIMGAKAKEAKGNVDDLSKRMEALGLTAEEAAKQKVAEFVSKNEQLSSTMKLAGLSTADLQAAIVGGSAALADFDSKLTVANNTVAYSTVVGRGAGEQRGLDALSMAEMTGSIGKQATAYESLTKQTETTKQATQTLGETQKQLDTEAAASQKAYIDGALAANKDLVASEEGLVKAHQDEVKAQEDVTNAARAAIDAKWAYSEAVLAGNVSIADANTKLADHKTSMNDAAGAINSARDAAITTADAFVRMKGDVGGSKQANDDMITSLQNTANALAPKSPIRASILAYIADLQSIPTDVTTTVTVAYVDTGAPGTHHDSYTPKAVIPASAANNGNVIHSAKGGLFKARPGGYDVNLAEAGRDEAVVPLNPDGSIPSSGGGGVSVYVTVQGSVMTERDLVRTITDGIIDAQARGEIPTALVSA